MFGGRLGLVEEIEDVDGREGGTLAVAQRVCGRRRSGSAGRGVDESDGVGVRGVLGVCVVGGQCLRVVVVVVVVIVVVVVVVVLGLALWLLFLVELALVLLVLGDTRLMVGSAGVG
jgi:hypothetical protein